MTVRIRVIPCLDVADGRVVKGVNFVNLRDAGDPVEAARAYDAAGADELCFLDIGASHEGRETIVDVVRRTDLPVIASGGVKGLDDIHVLSLHAHEGIEGVITGRALYDGRLDLAAAIAMGNRK